MAILNANQAQELQARWLIDAKAGDFILTQACARADLETLANQVRLLNR